jgi:hypothetical protein
MPHLLLRKPKDFFLGLIFLGIAIGVVAYSREYDLGTARQMGPGYLPLVLGLLLGCFGALLTVGSFFGEHEPAEALGMRPSILILGAAALFGLLIRPTGLIVSILVLVVVSGLAYRSRKAVPLALYAIGLAAGCVIVFPWMLGQQIPVLGSWLFR